MTVAGVPRLARLRVWHRRALPGFLSAALHILNRRFDGQIADRWAPDPQVFSVFLTFAFLVVAFRTTNAINRYADAARYLHSLGAKWFDTASTLIAFCRVSEAPAGKIEMFQQVLVRLVSLLNALCLEHHPLSCPCRPSGQSAAYFARHMKLACLNWPLEPCVRRFLDHSLLTRCSDATRAHVISLQSSIAATWRAVQESHVRVSKAATVGQHRIAHAPRPYGSLWAVAFQALAAFAPRDHWGKVVS